VLHPRKDEPQCSVIRLSGHVVEVGVKADRSQILRTEGDHWVTVLHLAKKYLQHSDNFLTCDTYIRIGFLTLTA